MAVDPSAEILHLRATVRDLLALWTIPEAWVGREPPAIAADLADLLSGSLEVDFAFVRLCDPTGGQVVEVTRGNSWKAFPQLLQQHLAVFGQISRKEIVTNVGGVEESCCGVVIPIGVNSERGLVAAASDRPDFPDQIDQQLLSVAANDAATAFQNAFLIKDLRSAQEALRANEQELLKARDELEIKVAERTSELRRSERELRDVIDTIPAIAWSALPEGSNTYVNSRWVEYSGLPAEQMTGSGWHVATHPDDLGRHKAKWLACVASGEPFEDEVRFRRADGEYRWHLVRGVPLRDEAGNIVKWYGVVTDIEDRKRAEESLRSSEAYLAEAQRLSQTGSWAWNPATNKNTYESEEFIRVLGYDPRAPLPSFEEFIQRVHPDDRAANREHFEKAIRDQVDFEFEYRIVHSDKGVRDIRVVGHPVLSTSGNLVEFVGTVIDVTELRRSEMELRQMLDLTPQLVAVFGPNRERLYINRIAVDYLGLSLDEWRQRGSSGYAAGRPSVGSEVHPEVHPDDSQRLKAYSDRAFSSGSAFELEVRLRKADGSYRWFLARYNPVRDDKDRSSVGMFPRRTSKIESRLKTDFGAKTSLYAKKSTKPRCLKKSLGHLPL
jgi:PAS domain S-box-containing protein